MTSRKGVFIGLLVLIAFFGALTIRVNSRPRREAGHRYAFSPHSSARGSTLRQLRCRRGYECLSGANSGRGDRGALKRLLRRRLLAHSLGLPYMRRNMSRS